MPLIFLQGGFGPDGPPSREDLLNDHMERWYKVRKNWKAAAVKNEERYKESMSLLKEMFEK